MGLTIDVLEDSTRKVVFCKELNVAGNGDTFEDATNCMEENIVDFVVRSSFDGIMNKLKSSVDVWLPEIELTSVDRSERDQRLNSMKTDLLLICMKQWMKKSMLNR